MGTLGPSYQKNMGNLFLDGGLEERGHTDPAAVADAIIDFVRIMNPVMCAASRCMCDHVCFCACVCVGCFRTCEDDRDVIACMQHAEKERDMQNIAREGSNHAHEKHEVCGKGVCLMFCGS
jgi:hypothetical protein